MALERRLDFTKIAEQGSAEGGYVRKGREGKSGVRETACPGRRARGVRHFAAAETWEAQWIMSAVGDKVVLTVVSAVQRERVSGVKSSKATISWSPGDERWP